MTARGAALLVCAALGLVVPPGARADTGSAVVVPPPLEAGEPVVTAAASPSAVRLGETFTLFVTVTFDADVVVNLREPVELGGAFELRRRDSRDHAGADGRRVREYQLQLEAWDVGDLQVPPIAVTFTLGGRAGQVATNPVPIRVASTLGAVTDTLEPRGDAPPAGLTSVRWLWIGIAAGAGVLVLAAVAALLAWRAGRRRVHQLVGPGAAAVRLDGPGQRALARLLAIEQSGVLERDPARKAGYTAMVEVIRDYLGARYHVATADLTTAELAPALAPVAPEAERTAALAWLARCDVVKYGGLRATAAEARAVLADARALVVATTGAVTEPGGGAATTQEAA